jgi:hypothetical protein
MTILRQSVGPSAMARRWLVQRSVGWRALAALGFALLTACDSTAPYYKDSGGRVREPTPDDPRLPYAVQHGEYLKDENLWPYATRGPMNFLGKYRFSHNWFVVRGQCQYGRKLDSPDVIDADLTGAGRGFQPKPFVEGRTRYTDIVERNDKLFQGEYKVPARFGAGDRDGYFDSVCKLQADPQVGRYGGEATLAWLTIIDKSFEQSQAQGEMRICEPSAQPQRRTVLNNSIIRPSGDWKGCVVDTRAVDVLTRHSEIWMQPIGDTGYHLLLDWTVARPVTLDPSWFEERQRAFMQVIDSVKIEKMP